MPTPAVTSVEDAIENSLKAAAVAGGRVFHVHAPASAASADELVVIRPTKVGTNRKLGGITDFTTDFVLRCKVRHGVNHPRPHASVGLLIAAVYDRLVRIDPTLGGSAGAVEPVGVAFDFHDPDQAAAVADVHVRVLYRTNGSL